MKRKKYASREWFLRRAGAERVGIVQDDARAVFASITHRGMVEWTMRELLDTKRCAIARRLKRIRRGDVRAMKRFMRGAKS